MIHDKIPHNVRVSKDSAADETMLRGMYKAAAHKSRSNAVDAVTPSVKGLKGITPSTKGIAANARYADVAKRTVAVASGLDAILKIRDSAQAEENPVLAALVNNSKMFKAIGLMIEKLAAEIQAMLLEDQIAEMTCKSSGAADSTLSVFSVDYGLRLEAARKRAREVSAAINPARVAMGLPDTVATADDLFALGREVK
ncbi:hypothetical protein [Burkholderia sp. WSM2230]|uniref:hypothetical protein n=1 Tax=Burkholderia sp. WSM2230 TaxID=944435 RepID=UPI000557D179|nr:hypothetical protein [Burkholderia sp. WSM2230]